MSPNPYQEDLRTEEEGLGSRDVASLVLQAALCSHGVHSPADADGLHRQSTENHVLMWESGITSTPHPQTLASPPPKPTPSPPPLHLCPSAPAPPPTNVQ